MISMNTSTPMPPTQWVRLRQSSAACESASTSATTVEPVVVKPEMVSNSASTIEGISPLNRKGSAPVMPSRIQHSATVTKPSRA